jgi:hypothetical protein
MGKIKIFTISLLTMTVNPKVHSVIKILKTRETFTIKQQLKFKKTIF